MFQAILDSLLYRPGYFRMVEATATGSAGAMASSLVAAFTPGRVVDYGCGTGALIFAFLELGISATGTEWSPVARRRCLIKKIKVPRVDLRNPPLVPPVGRADLATSFEVAEHLPASAGAGFVSLLTATAPVVAFSAATPGQGGQGHINEQPHSYWIDYFLACGFRHDIECSFTLRSEWKQADVAPWYVNNLLIFRALTPQGFQKERSE